MSIRFDRRHPEGYRIAFSIFSRDELRAAWSQDGQGHEESMARGRLCYIAPCPTEEDALVMSALFVRQVFALPTCVHWDGTTISCYLGSGGGGNQFSDNMLRTHRLFRQYLDTRVIQTDPFYDVPLFADDHSALVAVDA